MPISRTLATVVLAFSLLAAACSDDAPTGVIFGEGEVPETVSESFPIPENARIGSTLINYDLGETEMIMIVPAAGPAVVAFYETNLPNAGYTIESSEGNQAEWKILFSDDEVEGSMTLAVGGVDVTQVATEFIET